MMGRRAACTGRLEEASRGFPTNYAGLEVARRRSGRPPVCAIGSIPQALREPELFERASAFKDQSICAAARKLRRQKYWFFITPKNAAIYRPLGHSHNREGDSGLIAGKMKVCENMLKRVLPRRIIAHSSPARSRRSVSAGQQAIRHLATPLTTDGAARVRQSPLGDSSHHRSAVLTCA